MIINTIPPVSSRLKTRVLPPFLFRSVLYEFLRPFTNDDSRTENIVLIVNRPFLVTTAVELRQTQKLHIFPFSRCECKQAH
jgi:hypothetical protein